MAIPLRNRTGETYAHFLVDADDYAAVMEYRWSGRQDETKLRVIRTTSDPRTQIQLPRQLLGLSRGDPQVDHINGDSLDNRRMNLRLATPSQNAQNLRGPTARSKSGVRGVYWFKGAWTPQPTLNGKRVYLGRFATLAEAEAVVVAWRREHMPFSEMDK